MNQRKTGIKSIEHYKGPKVGQEVGGFKVELLIFLIDGLEGGHSEVFVKVYEGEKFFEQVEIRNLLDLLEDEACAGG